MEHAVSVAKALAAGARGADGAVSTGASSV
jgi:hypothetical protein